MRSDLGMTGEISLRGLVLPVGAIKKNASPRRAGLRRVILPASNRREYEDIPATVRNKLEVVWVENIEDVLATALDASSSTTNRVAA